VICSTHAARATIDAVHDWAPCTARTHLSELRGGAPERRWEAIESAPHGEPELLPDNTGQRRSPMTEQEAVVADDVADEEEEDDDDEEEDDDDDEGDDDEDDDEEEGEE
jgi:hypothetical protein